MLSSKIVFVLIVSAVIGSVDQAIAEEPSPALSWNCSGCHGFEGVSEGPLVPSIAGMNARLFFYIMRGYQHEERPSTIMGRIAKGYRIKELRRMGHYFESRPWKAASGAGAMASADVDRGLLRTFGVSNRIEAAMVARSLGIVP